jgi:hypothetical protein
MAAALTTVSGMHDIDAIARACGVLVRTTGTFRHLATCWQVAPGEWVTAWSEEDPPGDDVRFIMAEGGAVAPVTGWECDGGIAGFTAPAAERCLSIAKDHTLAKRDRLWCLGYPSVIDHPAFLLHRGSLDPQRYFPYLCPWTLNGHCCLFDAGHGWITGRFYRGMAGSPVLDEQGQVIGILEGGEPAPEHPPLARFLRLG